MRRAGKQAARSTDRKHLTTPSRDFALIARKLSGVFNFIGNLAGISLPIVIGFLAKDGNFDGALLYIAVVSIIGFCSYFFLVGKVERIELPER